MAEYTNLKPELRSERRLSMGRWYFIAAIFVAMFAIGVANIVYTTTAIHKSEREIRAATEDSDRRWCALLLRLEDNNRQAPPTTEAGKLFAQDVHDLVVSLRC